MKKEENDNSSKNAQIEEFLSVRYEFRYNTVLHRAEYRPRGKSDYTSVDRYRINTLKRALDKEANIQTSTDNLYSIIESDFSPRINPVQDYFRALPPTKGNAEAITALADCVRVNNSEKWEEYLTKWLVAVVANAMDDKQCRNHTCLVLTGEQGKFKTTFLDLLCPPALSDYRYTGKILPRATTIALCCCTPFVIPLSLFFSPYYVTTTKNNTVKEKGLQKIFILRQMLLQSFYASTA